MGLNLAAMPVERPATDSGAPFPQHENGSDSEAVSANSNFDQMSNQEMRTVLQRIGISLPNEVWPMLKLDNNIFQACLKAIVSSTAPVNVDCCEAFFCSICIVEYSPSEQSRIPRNLACGHSFCTSCLIQSRSQHDHGNSVAYGIKCAICRSFTMTRKKDDVKALPKNFTAIAMLQSTKRQSMEAQAAASKRRRFDDSEALANAVRMCELLEGRPGISRDPAKAFQMAEEGSQSGCVHSKGILGRCYITGSGVGLDLHRGLELGRDSSLAGSAYGEFVVAFAYENGSSGVRMDLQESVEHYKLAVEHGIAEAQYRLAHVYSRNPYLNFGDKNQNSPNENPAIKNEGEALNLLRMASEQGHADAQISLALHLRAHAGYSAADYASPHNEAFRMLKLGLKQGSARRHLEGLHSIAHHYTCLGDHNEAFNHYKLASEKGDIESSFALAKMHQKGEVIIEDVAKAINIYAQLLENGEDWVRWRSIKAIRDLYLEHGNNVEALKWCKQGADEVFPDDEPSEEHLSLLIDLARMYQGLDPRDENIALKGDGIERDFVEAAKYYKIACELVFDPEECIDNSAQYELAKLYEEGIGVAQNFTEAVRLLKVGVARNNADCSFHLACMYEEGRGIAQDLNMAAKMFHDLYLDEYFPAYCRLASMHRDGRGVPQNKQEALHLLQLLENLDAKDENAKANYLHASILLESVKDLSKDPTIHAEVMRLLSLAAAENRADAQYLLACQLTSGDVEQTITLLRSASKSNTNATFKLACLLADGEGIECDEQQATKLLMSAASKGHLESHCQLAHMFEHGKGVVQSIEIAALLYGQAAEKKNTNALYNLARMHTHGLGVIQSHSDAFKYCRMAALQGFAQAKYDLALMYQHGVGTAIVRSESLRWFHEAAAEGHQEAAAAVSRLNIAATETSLPESESQRASP